MLRLFQWKGLGFLFPIALTIVLFLFQAFIGFHSLSANHIIINSILAIIIAVVASVVILLLKLILTKFGGKLGRLLLAKFALHILGRAYAKYIEVTYATGIGHVDGSVNIGLPLGEADGVSAGDRFRVVNTATREVLGVIQSIKVEASSCLCSVSDRRNPDFWEGLERRIYDPTPPAGVIFFKEAPDDFLDFAERLLQNWKV